jgi:hypothetical protein
MLTYKRYFTGSVVKQSVEGSLALSLDGGQQEADEQGGNTYTHTLQEREVGQPLILSDSDILSFSIDHGALNISTGSHASSLFSLIFLWEKKYRTGKILKVVKFVCMTT